MTMPPPVLCSIENDVAVITFNRPAALNALSVEMLYALHQQLEQLRRRDDYTVVLLCGAGEHFMAGGDLVDFSHYLNESAQERYRIFNALVVDYVNPCIEILQSLAQPVVAKIRGACAGFGLSLALAADLAISSDEATFSTAYAKIGLPADGGLSYFLPKIVGRRQAMALFLLSERFDAQRAKALGLVNDVVSADALNRHTDDLIATLQQGALHAMGEIKQLLYSQMAADAVQHSLSQQLQREADAFGRCSAHPEFAEGVQAFLDKRPADFKKIG